MIKVGEIITLDSSVEYAVLDKKELNGESYYILMTTSKPVKIDICTVEGNDEITIIEDPELTKSILLKMI